MPDLSPSRSVTESFDHARQRYVDKPLPVFEGSYVGFLHTRVDTDTKSREIKNQMIITVLSSSMLMLGSLNATASGFGASWKHDSSGTIHNSNSTAYQGSTQSAVAYKGSGFGGGWNA